MKRSKMFIFTVMIGILCVSCSNSDTIYTSDDFLPVETNTPEFVGEGFNIEYSISNDWGSGFKAEICITNTSNEIIKDWGLGFDFDREIISFSGAEMVSCENHHFIIRNDGYNNVIQPNETIMISFSAEGYSDIKPINYSLTQLPDNMDIQKNDNQIAYSINKQKDDNQAINDSDAQDYRKEKNIEDTDNDGVMDAIEIIMGADITKKDTDGDGLEDGFELYSYTDMTLVDTDNNGVSDEYEDFDGDGLVNIDEQLAGSSPDIVDTDRDGLTDYQEVKKYGTNPIIYDTDNDGLSDYDTIMTKSNLKSNN